MKFKCEKDALIKEITITQDIISSRNVLSILSNVYLEAKDNLLTIKATDLKVNIELSIPVDISVPGKTTVFCDKLFNIIKQLPPGEIEFELTDNSLLYIRPIFKKIEFNLRSISPDKFPEIPGINDDSYFEFPQTDFIEMVSNTIFAVSNDETRYFMNGVFLERIDDKVAMIASDGKRLSYIDKPLGGLKQNFNGIIIPTKLLSLLKKLLTGEGMILLSITDKNLFIKYGNHKFSTNLIEGQFPNYQRVIPQSQQNRVDIQKETFEKAIRRVSLLVEHKSRCIYLKFQPNNLIISSEDSEIGMAREEIECEYSGPEYTITLNYIYLLEPLSEIKDDQLSIEFTDNNKAITIKSLPERDFIHIIMPMQAK